MGQKVFPDALDVFLELAARDFGGLHEDREQEIVLWVDDTVSQGSHEIQVHIDEEELDGHEQGTVLHEHVTLVTQVVRQLDGAFVDGAFVDGALVDGTLVEGALVDGTFVEWRLEGGFVEGTFVERWLVGGRELVGALDETFTEWQRVDGAFEE